ncbi:adenylate/guanylate cyclase domain-containing protein [Entomomonas moraniae]|uniref:Adenylate/guanylate cyclase domain-containing protein n=1 Tax=Entomomonas moraniae TaxID=2213226 RepID=A0A3S9XE28_9GAMM|nr:adenylate/guanylate cyclase domain-containing protein [Entomomonas moraniae]AZS50590.1 adenylate/guanylate cyclase domain-containing protein [Entomomonas moraniae]
MQKLSLYHLRFFAYFCFAMIIIASQYIGYLDRSSFIILLCLSILTPCTGYLSSFAKVVNQQDILALVLLDAIVASIVLLLLDETNIIALLFVLMIMFNTFISSNTRLTIISICTLILLTGISNFYFDKVLFKQPPNVLIVISMLCTGLYLGICAIYILQIKTDKESLQHQIFQNEKNQQATAKLLTKYISPPVWDSIFGQKKNQRIETQRKRLTIFFSDIKDFTQLSDELEAEALTEILNHYLTEMSTIAQNYNGTIDKFVGDSIMVIFGDNNSLGSESDAIAATSMAIAMQNQMKYIRSHWASKGIKRHIEVRMGINTGFCTIGNFGANSRMEYTTIGREVNLASRLENAAEPGKILISETTHALIKDFILCNDMGEIKVRGFANPIRTYEVAGLRSTLSMENYYVEEETKGFSLYLDSIHIKSEEKAKVITMLEEASAKLKNIK